MANILLIYSYTSILEEISDVKSLAKQCQWYIFMHMEEFPTSSLSLLPLSTREKLLRRLPVADVCLLEDSNFMKEIDMGDYWSICTFEANEMQDIKYLLQEMRKAQFYKTILYGAVVSCYFGLAQLVILANRS